MERIRTKKEFAYNPGDHVSRYIWVFDKIKGKVTLDAGCGEGYGTSWLRTNGINVLGVDCSRTAFKSSEKKGVIRGDILFMPFHSCKFDAIISFEVIEHLKDGNMYLSQVSNLLKPHGIFLGSTPIRKKEKYLNDRPKNPFHKREYYIDEIKDLLEKHFEKVQIFGQIFPSKIKVIFLSQMNRLKIYRDQHKFYPIHMGISPTDEKCLWIAKDPRKYTRE